MTASKNKQKSQGLPDHVIGLLAAADQRNGLPPGTMYSVMQHEVGGQTDRFMADPSAYHYAANDKGQRIAAHTGKISTAFGPFGILESTGRDPGYGVAPLKDKTIEEQIRFSSDYLAARSKSGGSLQAGLAGYGEGEKYAAQVAGRIGGVPTSRKISPALGTQLASAAPVPVGNIEVADLPPQADAPVVTADAMAVHQPVQVAANVPPDVGPNAWQEFLNRKNQASAQPVQVADLNWGNQVPQVQVPDFMSVVRPQQSQPNFQMLRALKGWA